MNGTRNVKIIIFNNPKSSKEYLPLFKKYFCDYKKGELPIQLNKNTLENMFKNLNEFNNYSTSAVQK